MLFKKKKKKNSEKSLNNNNNNNNEQFSFMAHHDHSLMLSRVYLYVGAKTGDYVYIVVARWEKF